MASNLWKATVAILVLVPLVGACGDSTGEGLDSSVSDTGPGDGAVIDSRAPDSATDDSGAPDSAADDSGASDSGAMDGGADGGPDGGPDGGVGMALPLDHAFPASATGPTITRLGRDTFVLAYADDTDLSTPAGEDLVLQRVRRVQHRLVFDAPARFAQVSIEPGSDNPLHVIGAFGEAHFFVVVLLPGYTSVIRYFKVDAGAFVDLGTESLGGTDFGGPPAFFQGHPVDATRHLLGYREDNSGQPMQYRLILRTGDTFSLGAPVTRPPPSAFTGLSTSESQADPALLRVGPTTFVEARPGYVFAPGYLATWTLTVGAGDALAASGPTVHATVGQTMSPEVAADGHGGALVTYHQYGETDWRYGTYSHALGTLTEVGVLGTSDDATIRGHQGESTDRFLGHSYYLRLPGTGSGDSPLFRVDATDGTVERLPDVPGYMGCYRTAQMARSGTIAAYVGCEVTRFVDLRPLCGDGTLDADEDCDDGNNDDGDACTAGCTTAP